jgi:hypothetical protein
MTEEKVHVPREILWDYREPPDDLMWRLQRLADFFPAYGVDRKTVRLLFEHRDRLKLEPGRHKLIGMYHDAWQKADSLGD